MENIRTMKSMNDELTRIEELYHCSFFKYEKADVNFLRLCTKNKVSMNNLIHIKQVLSKHNYQPYCFEAMDDTLFITFYEKK